MAEGETQVGKEGWKMLIEKTNLTSLEVNRVKVYWTYSEMKLLHNGIFKPYSEPVSKELMQLAFGTAKEGGMLLSLPKCQKGWKKEIHPLITARLFQIMEPSPPTLATFGSSIWRIGVICRGSVYEMLDLVFEIMDFDDDGYITESDVHRIMYLVHKTKLSGVQNSDLPLEMESLLRFLFAEENWNLLQNKLNRSKSVGATGGEINEPEKIKRRKKKGEDEKKGESEDRKKRKKRDHSKRSSGLRSKSPSKSPPPPLSPRAAVIIKTKKEDGKGGSLDENLKKVKKNKERPLSQSIRAPGLLPSPSPLSKKKKKESESSKKNPLIHSHSLSAEGVETKEQEEMREKAVLLIQRWWRRRQSPANWTTVLQETVFDQRHDSIAKERQAMKVKVFQKFDFFESDELREEEEEEEEDVHGEEFSGEGGGGDELRKSLFESADPFLGGKRVSGDNVGSDGVEGVEEDFDRLEMGRYYRALYLSECRMSLLEGGPEEIGELPTEKGHGFVDFSRTVVTTPSFTSLQEGMLLTSLLLHSLSTLCAKELNEKLPDRVVSPLKATRVSLQKRAEEMKGVTFLRTVRDVQNVVLSFTRRGEVLSPVERDQKFNLLLHGRLACSSLRELRQRNIGFSEKEISEALKFPKHLSLLINTHEWLTSCAIQVILIILRLFRLLCSYSCFRDDAQVFHADLFEGFIVEEGEGNTSRSLAESGMRRLRKYTNSNLCLGSIEQFVTSTFSKAQIFPLCGPYTRRAVRETYRVLTRIYVLYNHVVLKHWSSMAGVNVPPVIGGLNMLSRSEFKKLVMKRGQKETEQVAGLFGTFEALKPILEGPVESKWKSQRFDNPLLVYNSATQQYEEKYCRWFSGTLDIYEDSEATDATTSITLLDHVLINADTETFSWDFSEDSSSNLRFKALSKDDFRKWHNYFTILSSELGGNPFDSFAPPRSQIETRFYLCGREYYRRAAQAILAAKKTIYISDWWLSPEVYLIRDEESARMIDPDIPENEIDLGIYQLERLLKTKAQQNVQIYVLVWKHTKVAVDLGSSGIIAHLKSLHPNINGICHPPSFPINWSHHQKTLVIDEGLAFVGGLDLCFGRYDDHTSFSLSDNVHIRTKWPGKDYYNPRFMPGNPHNPYHGSLDRSTQCRMPWQDVMLEVDGAAAWDVAKNFVQRWNHHREKKFEELSLGAIIPSGQGPLASGEKGTSTVQVLRSICKWSGGTKVEKSIYRAMKSLIEHAKHYIYIENQYFISSTGGGGIKNDIAKYLIARIKKAHRENQKFRVIIVLPVHPEGSLSDEAILYIMKWEFQTIARGGKSMMEVLEAELGREVVSQYVCFLCLRNYVSLQGELHTEQIYVHTKLMIVDDRIVICGSANINDRSLLGTRDSEIAVLIEDSKKIETPMGGKPHKSASFAHTLRRRLWGCHLGVSPDDPVLLDPIAPECYEELWLNRAKKNTAAYFGIFSSLPNNSISDMGSVWERLMEQEISERKRSHSLLSKTTINQDSLNGMSFPFGFSFHPETTGPLSLQEDQIPLFCECCLRIVSPSDCPAPLRICLVCRDKCFDGDTCRRFSSSSSSKGEEERQEGSQEKGQQQNCPLKYLKENVKGYVCCFPSEYLKECSLDSKLLGNVVGKTVFQ